MKVLFTQQVKNIQHPVDFWYDLAIDWPCYDLVKILTTQGVRADVSIFNRIPLEQTKSQDSI